MSWLMGLAKHVATPSVCPLPTNPAAAPCSTGEHVLGQVIRATYPWGMPGQSVFRSLEPLLEQVSKPIQYVGGELNSTVKDWDVAGDATVRWALMYPDAYEVGVPNQGVMILYEVLNERPDALAERTYAVWPDLEALMREHGVPQFTVDAHRPVGDFDLLGLSFSTELGYTNMLTALDLAGIPLHAVDRDETHPIVVAGGHAAFNPETIADFVDAAVVGDGEEAVLAITDIVGAWKREGMPGGRRELLLRLARTGGVYVPAFYDVELPAGRPDPADRARTPPACRGGWPSTPSWTSTPGRTPSSRSCRSPSRCTSGCRSRSSAAAPGAAGSARRA